MHPRRGLCLRQLLVWGLLLLSLVPACGKTSSDGQTTITFACSSGDVAAYRILADKFAEQQPHIHIQLRQDDDFGAELSVEGANNLEGRLRLLRARATRSDVFLVQSGDLSAVDRSPDLLDLTTFFQEDKVMEETDFVPAALAAFRRSEKLYAVPVAVDPIVMVYDRELFDRGQVPYPAPGWTWSEFLERARALTMRNDTENGNDALQYGYADTPFIGVLAWLYAHGGSLWRSDDASGSPSPNLDDQRVAETLQWYIDLALAHQVMPPPVVAEDPYRLWDLRQDRRVAMWSDGLSSAASYLRGPGPKTSRLSLAPLPQESVTAFPAQAWGYAISAGTAHPQACWEWISFLSRQASPVSRFEGAVPARISLAEETAYWDRWDKDDAQAIAYALDHPAPTSEWDVLGYLRDLDPVLNGQSDVETFLAGAQQQAQTDLRALAQATPAPPVAVHTPQAAGAEKTTVRFVSRDTSMIDGYRRLAEAFMAKHLELNVEVKTGIEVFGSETYATTEMLAQEADVFMLTGPASSTLPEKERQYLLELTPFVTSDHFPLDDFISPARPLQQGQVWGIPLTAKLKVAYFNRMLFGESEVSPPVAGWTWDDLIEKAEAITVRGDERDYFGFADSSGTSHFYFLFAKQAPLVDMTSSPPSFLLDSFDVEQIGRQWVTLNQDYGPGLFTEENGDRWYGFIRTGRVGMWMGRSDEFCQMRDKWPFEMGIVSLPRGSEGVTPVEVRTAVISAQTEHPRAAWMFVRYLSDHAQAGGCRVPLRWSNLQSDAPHQQVDEAMLAVVEDMAAHWTPIPSVENMDAETLRYYEYASVAAYCFGQAMSKAEEGMALKQALQEAQRDAEETYKGLFSDNSGK